METINNEILNDEDVDTSTPEVEAIANAVLSAAPTNVIESNDNIEDFILSPEQREQQRLAKKPSIDHLSPGVIVKDNKIVPLFSQGDRIVVERYATLVNGCPWLDTFVARVISLDTETGVVRITDEETQHAGFVSFKQGHTVIKLAPKSGNPFEGKRMMRRSKTMKKIIEAQIAKDEEEQATKNNDKFAAKNVENQQEKKKGRGRPKGSKNRDKETIKNEKLAKRASKKANGKKREKKG